MKTITLETNVLKNAVALAKRAAFTNADNIDILCIEGKDGKLSVKATDYIEAIIAQNIAYVCSDITDMNFCFYLDIKNLLSALNTVKSDDISFDIKEDSVVLKSGKNKFKINTIDEELKVTRKVKGTKITIDMKFIESLKIIYHSVDKNNPKFELNSCCIKALDNKLVVVGTNTRVLAHASTKLDDVSFDEILIPKSAMKTIIDLFSGINVEAVISKTTFSISTEDLYYETKLTNGSFVSWERIIPARYKHVISLPKEGFETMVKNACVFDGSQVSVLISEGKITVCDSEQSAISSEDFEDKNIVIDFCINGSLLLDLLASIKKSKKFELCYNEPNLPITIKLGDSFQEIMMPIIREEKEEEKAS